MANILVNAPKTARRGDVIEIKALIMHPMETGFRPGPETDRIGYFSPDTLPAMTAEARYLVKRTVAIQERWRASAVARYCARAASLRRRSRPHTSSSQAALNPASV